MWHSLCKYWFGSQPRSESVSRKTALLGLEELEPRLAPSSLPTPTHVVIAIEENKTFSSIIGSEAAPYINSLAQQGALMTNSSDLTLDSLSNYLWLFSGSNQGVSRGNYPSNVPAFSTPNLGSELIAAGSTFDIYSEDLPYPGFMGGSSGEYTRGHNPAAYFTNVPAANNLPFSSFPSDFSRLPTVSIVVPDLLNDMHDGSIQQGDTWLQDNLDAYVNWARMNNSLLIVTWDEGSYKPADNHIPTLLVGAMVNAGQYGEAINHINVLRTIEDMYGLPYAGETASATPITDVWVTAAAPVAPTNLTSTVVSASAVNLAWTETSTNQTGFQIQQSTDGTNFTTIANVAANATSANVSGLSANAQYYFRVLAYNGAGSAASNVVTTMTAVPAAPTNLTAKVGSSWSVSLTWTDNSFNETGFQILRSTDGTNYVQSGLVGANVTDYKDRGLTPNTHYYYRLIAYNGVGNSAYANVVITLTAAPAAPSNLTATVVSATCIKLTWTNNAINQSGFKIQRSTDGINFTQIITLSANVTSFSNGNLTANTQYYYLVLAYNGVGNSAYTNVVTTLTAAPAAPSNLTATAGSSGTINLAWTDNSINETGFKIQRSTDGTHFTQIAFVGANVTAFSDSGLAANIKYYYRLQAYNGVGNSNFTNFANIIAPSLQIETIPRLNGKSGTLERLL